METIANVYFFQSGLYFSLRAGVGSLGSARAISGVQAEEGLRGGLRGLQPPNQKKKEERREKEERKRERKKKNKKKEREESKEKGS